MTMRTHTLPQLIILALLLTPSLLHAQTHSATASGGSPPVSSTLAPAPLTPHDLQRVTRVLSAHHSLPTQAQLLAITPLAREALSQLATTPTLHSLQRRRALLILAESWPDDATFSLLSHLLSDPNTPSSLTPTLLHALATNFEQRAIPLLTPHLLHPEEAHRLAAIQALCAMHDPQAEPLLHSTLASEPLPHLRDLLTARLAQLP